MSETCKFIPNGEPLTIHMPTPQIVSANPLPYLPGQIAAALLDYDFYSKQGAEAALALRTVQIVEAICERLKQSKLYAPAFVYYPPPAQNEDLPGRARKEDRCDFFTPPESPCTLPKGHAGAHVTIWPNK